MDSRGKPADAELPRSPELTLNLALQYETPVGDYGDVRVRGEWLHVGSQFFTQFNRAELSERAVSIFNARLEFTAASGRWSVAGWDHPTFGDFPEEAAAGFAAGTRADRSILRDFLAGTFGEMPAPEIFAEMYAQTCLTPTDAVADMVEDMARQDYRDVVKSIDLPTLLLYAGAKNVTLPTPVGEWMRDNIKGSELMMFDDSGHSLFWEEPEKFNKAVAEFASK